jgi:hypothetical protein
MDHDQNFKNLILDYPAAALEFFAGIRDLDGAAITPLREEQLQEVLGSRYRRLDAPLEVDWPDGRREAVLFVVEEETEPADFSIHRLAHYCLDLSELLKTERVVPVVVFLRAGRFPRQLRLGDDERAYLSFDFRCCELARLAAEDHRNSGNLVARLNLPNMRHPKEGRVEVYASAVEGLLALESNANKQRKYLDFIDVYANLSADEVARYRAEYIDTPEETNMGLVSALLEERWQKGKAEGEAEGKAEGKAEGRKEGESRIITGLLTLRFGKLPEWAEAKLAEAAPEQLEAWSLRIVAASALEDVFAP